MASQPFRPSIEELNYFIVSSLVIAAAFTAYKAEYSIRTAGFYLVIAGSLILMRELGQRSVAKWLGADVKLEISLKGSIVTITGAFVSVIVSLPFILIFPIFNEYSMESYEQWGREIDVIWPKREYWLATAGILFLLLGWTFSFLLGWFRVAEAFSLFTAFQLMPFDYSKIPTGGLDGAAIIHHSGFSWALLFGTSWVTLALIWV